MQINVSIYGLKKLAIINIKRVNRFWQSSNLFLAPILIVILIYYHNSLPLYQLLLCLHLPFLMIHEIEEYVLSPLSFKEFFNLKSPFGSKTDPDFPLDENYVFQVNIIIAWPIIIIGATLANIAPWIGFSMMLFELIINNITHTVIFQTDKPSYNPGLITNSILLIPLATVTLLTALSFFHWYDWLLSIIVGGIIAAILLNKTKSRLAKLQSNKSIDNTKNA